MRTFLKKARVACDNQSDDASVRVNEALKELDKMASKGIIKKNNANRRKSRLMRHLNKALNIGRGSTVKTEEVRADVPSAEEIKPENTESASQADVTESTDETTTEDTQSESSDDDKKED